ncbi:MAG: deoxyribonuclease IV [Peptoniphilus sp.]|nr:deoxyribonuclease IV [Peptoniphilus sp.]MDY3118236.1 deoxyribonuclease IV [Peptoniphilus sp.]
MLTLGYHTSTADGFVKTMKAVQAHGARTFQFFTRNPRGSKARPLDLSDLEAFQREKKTFGPVVAHAAYIMNLASGREDVRKKSFEIFLSDMARIAHYSEDVVYVFHPGSHTKDGIETGIERIIEAMDRAKEAFPHRAVCLETMSGKGTEIGGRLEEIQKIIDAVASDDVGVVLDTCHLFSAGYDLSDPEAFFNTFDSLIGLEKIKAVHVNDSQMPFGAKKDRHAPVGAGEIGWDTLARFLYSDPVRRLPMILETPGEAEDHEKEMAQLQAYIQSM